MEKDPEEPVPLPPEELERRKHQIWLITGVMVLSFCIFTALLFLIGGVVFGDSLRSFVSQWLGR